MNAVSENASDASSGGTLLCRSLSSDGLESSRKSDSSKELSQSIDELSSGHNTNANAKYVAFQHGNQDVSVFGARRSSLCMLIEFTSASISIFLQR